MTCPGGLGSWLAEPRDGPFDGELAMIKFRSAGAQGKPTFGREGQDFDRRGSECGGVWVRDDRYPGRRRPDRLA